MTTLPLEWSTQWRPIGFDARIPLELVPDDQFLLGCRDRCSLELPEGARCGIIPDDHKWLFYSMAFGDSKYVPITYKDVFDWARPEDYYRSRRSENTVVLNESPGSYLDDPCVRLIIEALLPKHHNYIEPNAEERSFTTTDAEWKSTETLRRRYISAGYAQEDFVVCEMAYAKTEDLTDEYPVADGGTLVGYEVCNIFGHSPIHAEIHGEHYTQEQILWLRDKYQKSLNKHLLFNDALTATQFLRDISQILERVQGFVKPPFDVIALVLLPAGLERLVMHDDMEDAYIVTVSSS